MDSESQPMQILFLSFNVAYKGGATFYRAMHLAQGLACLGHQVTLIASSPGNMVRFSQKVKKGFRLVEAPGIFPTRWRHGYDPYETLRRVKWVSQRTFEIVHAFDSRPVVIYPALFAHRKGSRLIMDWCDWFGRGGAAEQRANPILRTVMRYADTYYEEAFRRRADATTVINTALEQRALHLGIPSATIYRLPNGADTENIRPIDQQAAQTALGLSGNAPLLGYVGALFPGDARLLSEAFLMVQEAKPQARLLIIGNPKVNLPPQEGVIKTGFVTYEQLNLYLASCDILLLPLTDNLANRGRWPSKIGDYFAAGRPTVACAVGDMPQVLEETGAGLTTDPAVQPFAAGILRLLDDPSLRFQMGKKARHAAESRYNWQTLVNQVENLYLKVLRNPHSH